MTAPDPRKVPPETLLVIGTLHAADRAAMREQVAANPSALRIFRTERARRAFMRMRGGQLA